MKLKKLLLRITIFILLLFFPYSCLSIKNTGVYPINSKWIYYDGVNDSTIVYINHITFIEGIFIRDTELLNDSTIVGWVNKKNLFPIE